MKALAYGNPHYLWSGISQNLMHSFSDGHQSATSEHVTVVINGSPVKHSITESHSLAPKSTLERQGDTRSQSRRSDRSRNDNILDIKAESLPSYRFDEEVVGIITMEDLMEELLQVENHFLFFNMF